MRYLAKVKDILIKVEVQCANEFRQVPVMAFSGRNLMSRDGDTSPFWTTYTSLRSSCSPSSGRESCDLLHSMIPNPRRTKSKWTPSLDERQVRGRNRVVFEEGSR
jgi:hypothetical protein